jgi:hypothetical protein
MHQLCQSWQLFSAQNMTDIVKSAAAATNLVAQGYDLKRVGTHSLRASGATALKLQGRLAYAPADLQIRFSRTLRFKR